MSAGKKLFAACQQRFRTLIVPVDLLTLRPYLSTPVRSQGRSLKSPIAEVGWKLVKETKFIIQIRFENFTNIFIELIRNSTVGIKDLTTVWDDGHLKFF